jgi:hypothetical protein
MKIFYTLLLIICSLHTSSQSVKNVRKAILEIAKDETTDAFYILNKVGDYNFEKFAKSNDLEEIIKSFGTVVHESCHILNSLNWEKEWDETGKTVIEFYITDDIQIPVIQRKLFNSRKLNKTVPDSLQKKMFRYSDYIGKKHLTGISSQNDGIYGILDEFCAYYHGTKAKLELYDYYYKKCNGFNKPNVWADYFSGIGNTHFAYYEFNLFIVWYLQYAQKYEKEIYTDILNNYDLRAAYTLLDQLWQELFTKYYKRLDEVIEGLNKNGIHAEIKKVVNTTCFRYQRTKKRYSGKSIFEDEIIWLKTIHDKQDFQLLEKFKLNNCKLDNYKTRK